MGIPPQTGRSRWSRWWRRTTVALVAATALAVTLGVTGVVPTPTFLGGTEPIGVGDLDPRSSAPEAPIEEPAPASAAADPATGAAPVSTGRFGGALLAAPDEAIGAYQRAASIINLTAECELDWIVLAAIARVESNHGRGADGRHRVDRQGRVRPALTGAPLNGRAGRDRVFDTDAGELDGRVRWDAPVGPFGLLPATWSNVAVDGDGDGIRNPQDLDDAALATAVLLCASGRDLSRRNVLAKELQALHPAPGYVRVVMMLAALYSEEVATAAAMVSGPTVLTAVAMDLSEVDVVCRCTDQVRVLLGHDTTDAPTSGTAPTGPDSGRPDSGGRPAEDPDPDPDPEPDPEPEPGVEPEPSTEPDQPQTDVPAEELEEQPTQEPTPDPTEEPADQPTCDVSATADETRVEEGCPEQGGETSPESEPEA